jgi:arsenite methyltransferase
MVENDKTQTNTMSTRVDYGVDGYPYIIGLCGGGTIGMLSGGMLAAVAKQSWLFWVGMLVAGVSSLALAVGLLGVRYVRIGKFAHRDRILERIAWRGDEHVLDVGTGGGLLLIGSAKRLQTGRAYGIDIWSTADLSGNTLARVLRNAKLEGAAERIEVHDANACSMPFANETFDVVVSTLCIHNIEQPTDRDAALRQIVRVLKKGGVALISDLAHTEHYAELFQQMGLQVQRSSICWDTFPFQRIVEAHKPSQSIGG